MSGFGIASGVALWAMNLVSPAGRSDLPITDFARGSYGSWTATGTAFNPGPAPVELLTKLAIGNARSGGVISSEIEGDEPTGILSSPVFKIERKFISFLIGGGDEEFLTSLELLIDGKIVKSATGRRSDHLAPESWDVSRWQGKSAQIRVVDQASGDWGHVNVDRIVQTDAPERPPVVTAPLYQESLRPQFHFTARQWTMDRLNPGMRQEGWINDLNGLIYYEGEYHLFAQRWAKCWLHAVSRDLVHWEELEPAFWEESLGSGVQSGTCVIDYENTSGLSKDISKPPMIAFWSRWDNVGQCISYSLDKGRTWMPYAGNPIFEKRERDPKVFWYAPGKHWVMMMYGDGAYHVLTSPDLLHWKDEGHPIADSYECPDFFELPIDGDNGRKKWVLIQGNGNYSLGTFDGKEFKEETGRRPCDVGPNFYATQSWHNNETGDGRRVQVAWMRGPHFPEMPFNQQISFPCELTLRTTPDGLRIFREPVKDLDKLQGKPQTWTTQTLAPGVAFPLTAKGDLYRLKAEVEISDEANLVFSLRGESFSLSPQALGAGDPNASVQGRVKTIEVLLDRASLEVFVNGGEVSSTRTILPKSEGLFLKAEGGPVVIRSLTLWSLHSTWR